MDAGLRALVVALTLVGAMVVMAGRVSAQEPSSEPDAESESDSEPEPDSGAEPEPLVVELVGTCDLSLSDIRGDRASLRTLTVTVAYCDILRRPPDAEGLAYWTGQLAAGLRPYELVELFFTSPEFQARQAKSFQESLASLTLGPGREAEREARQKAAEEAAAQAYIEQELAAREAKFDAALRVRNELTVAEFDGFVDSLGLQDLDRVTSAVVHGRIVGDGQRVNVAAVHLSATRGVSVSPGDRGRSRVGTWAEEIGATVAINGNWYGPWDGPAVSGGVAYGGDDHFYTALFGFTADGDAVIEHHREIRDEIDPRVVEGVSGHPTLVFRGERTTDFGTDPTFLNRHPRTAIGLDESGDVLLLVTADGRSRSAAGMTGDETAQLLARLRAHDAVMLDGGGSTTMWIAGRGVVNQPSGGLRAVGNQIAAFGD